ncbi:MAG TPA: hypothetical protein DD435_01055 [Cyanobacteria bacterium UBA8530]|nr:hypothetical protein [Cyanobacteria bacterium UBA8530]
MSLFFASDLAFSYPACPDTLFSKVSFTIRPRDRIALLGPNGCGKTTLLRILNRELVPSQGALIPKPGLRVSSIAQEGAGLPGELASDYAMRADPALYALSREIQSLERRLGDESLALRYADLLNLYGEQGGYAYQARADRILEGLGVRNEAICDQLSGGERTRLELAKLLLNPGELLLLDEPTNHLDTKAMEWLEGYLAGIPSAVLFVSHDRAFLERTAERIFELRQGKLAVFERGYFSYREERARLDSDAWDRYEENQQTCPTPS